MKVAEVERAVTRHLGQVHCSRINGSGEKKVVDFRHLVSPQQRQLGLYRRIATSVERMGDSLPA
jgi:hypothetical protein